MTIILFRSRKDNSPKLGTSRSPAAPVACLAAAAATFSSALLIPSSFALGYKESFAAVCPQLPALLQLPPEPLEHLLQTFSLSTHNLCHSFYTSQF
jgi:hypothetical protein